MTSRTTQALAALLPTGYAWPRDPASVWMRVIEGLAGSFDELQGVTEQATNEWLPHATHTRLAEWEAATGLPDDCFGPTQTYAARQARLVARLRGPSGAYADSSPGALGAIEAVVAHMGFTATAHYNTRFRCGRDRCGRRLGTNNGKLYLMVATASTPFRVGTSRTGERLVEVPPDVAEMTCAVERFVPARFELNVIYL